MSNAPLLTRLKGFRALILFLVCVVVFVGFPQIDLFVAGLFYDAQSDSFIYKNQPLVQFLYRLFAYIQIPVLLGLIVTGLLIKFKKVNFKHYKKWTITFLLLALILGPGLLVNTVIKNNSIGRARPVQVENFGGHQTFTPAFVYSGACSKNCSFVSGHAAMGFYFMILGWLFTSRRAFWGGCLVGLALGFTRIVQGGHFLSDVLFAFWAVYFVTWGLAVLFGFKHPLDNKPS
ncbi:phosphatase PAP2 family protein [Amphritea sp. 2_MG-2023]|uniref:phosphatase PAP2 family protein n=1 Tax=Amphritea TaxID=515417 RepID=UPI001C068E16|nr:MULTISPECIES: phosphatase PAP2 family protein [Amphritea]MBU2964767.1 phosphatase PAP2 family protein [Amphritea atlantica]MDO6417164.1 phosphatase PAP2 family protein [Amphritea sp. 2_MG-2023]